MTPHLPGSLPLAWAGASLRLLPGGGVFHADSSTLLVADLHLGKAELFRRRGVPVPDGDDAADLARLDATLRSLEARRLVVLGDLVHGPESWTPALAQALARALSSVAPEARLLVAGNHDRQLPPTTLGFRILAEGARLPPSVGAPPAPGAGEARREGPGLRHVPLPEGSDTPHLAGHLHPVMRLAGGGDRLRIPCFVITGSSLILPAYGGFTGGHPWSPRAGDRIFLDLRPGGGGHGVEEEGKVVEIPRRD